MKGTDVINQTKKWLLMGTAAAMLAGSFYVPIAAAHGERSQAAFLRMRTIHWYDLKWSKDTVEIGQNYTLSGKFHTFSEWPEAVDLPRVSFLNIGQPGPVFIRTGSYINDIFVPRSVGLELGGDYSFLVELKARRVGNWHVHAMMNIQGGGPLIGPGKWVTITGNEANFKDEITTLTGRTLDLEDTGMSKVIGWHGFWYLIGIGWIFYWARRPLFLVRHMKMEDGVPDNELFTATDTKAATALLVGTLVVIMYGFQSTESEFPITIPLQSGLLQDIKPLPPRYGKDPITAKITTAGYRVPGRTIKFKVEVTNHTDKVMSIGEFDTGGVRFLNPNVIVDDTGYPEELLAPEGLEVSQQDIAPGETVIVEVVGTDAAWEVQRLSDVIYDPDSRFGGLLFFVDPEGRKIPVEVGSPLIPSFA
ncbi:methane monooxygenase/ammonia monooxygenase subunit B [Candidatus Nitrosacidococcus tergens]|uniref:Ammonia monooxygenase subunit B n=1 Tax=Candidatus Nitrosacidococcus tergens TaxID=553981 RepID=A0A7G1QAG2_9GAMM|nr:methane monooxygenase/ammonia monooxygenase subunit B [Candidatus Nitrosacidococcus tergens]CAB1276649.1 Ammonia monooxygenase subunit B [Candidatus Nitrosacidococcus tergens]